MTSNITCEVFEKSAAGLDKKCIARITVDGSIVKSTSHKHCIAKMFLRGGRGLRRMIHRKVLLDVQMKSP